MSTTTSPCIAKPQLRYAEIDAALCLFTLRINVDAASARAAPSTWPIRRYDVDQGGLAGPVVPDQGYDLSPTDLEVHALEGLYRSEGFVDAPNAQ